MEIIPLLNIIITFAIGLGFIAYSAYCLFTKQYAKGFKYYVYYKVLMIYIYVYPPPS